MSDDNQTMPVGGEGSPAGSSEPGGAAEGGATQTATSGAQPGQTGQQGEQQEANADQAFEQFLATNPADNPNPTNDDSTKAGDDAAKGDKSTTEADGAKADAEKGEDEEPQADDAETKEGKVPLKKLHRALNSRRKIKAELDQERAVNDRILGTFDAMGIDPETLPGFLANLAKAPRDEEARNKVLAVLGVAAQAKSEGYSEDEARAAIERAVEDVDPEAGMQTLRDKRKTQQPHAKDPQPKKPTNEQPGRPAYGEPELRAEVRGMGASLVASHGKEEAQRLATAVEARVKVELQRLRDLDMIPTHQAVAKLYREAQGAVMTAEQSNRARPPRTQRPTHTAPSASPAKADDAFEAWQQTGR